MNVEKKRDREIIYDLFVATFNAIIIIIIRYKSMLVFRIPNCFLLQSTAHKHKATDGAA
jgi:hypothetical protein